jgi:hypothetical protein
MAVARILSRAGVGLVAALLLAPAAGALQITGLSIATTGSNSAPVLVDNSNRFSQIASSTSIVIAPGGAVPDTIGQSVAFETRYASLLAADSDSGGAAQTLGMTSDYSITFTIDNPAGETYRVDIATLRAGALTIVSDAGGPNTATASIGAVTGRVDSIVNGSLALAAVGPLINGNTTATPFSQSSTTLSITDSALSRAFTLDFNWTGSTTTNNDEAAVRMGINGGIANATADDYPGVGARTVANDGHFVDVTATIISAPEPAPAALVAFGLLGLAIRARRAGTRRR